MKKHKSEIKSNYKTITWELFQEKEREISTIADDFNPKEIKNKFHF